MPPHSESEDAKMARKVHKVPKDAAWDAEEYNYARNKAIKKKSAKGEVYSNEENAKAKENLNEEAAKATEEAEKGSAEEEQQSRMQKFKNHPAVQATAKPFIYFWVGGDVEVGVPRKSEQIYMRESMEWHEKNARENAARAARKVAREQKEAERKDL